MARSLHSPLRLLWSLALVLVAMMVRAQPPNDNPCGATALTVNATCSPVAATSQAATNTAGVPAPTCGFYINRDVWFTVVVPPNGFVLINSTPQNMTDGAMAVYTAASCAGPFTQIACNDDQSATNFMPQLTLTGLTPGSTIYIRFWRYFGGTGQSFNICATSPPSGAGCIYWLQLFDSANNGWGGSSVGVSINGGPFTNYTVTGSYYSIFLPLNVGDILVIQYNGGGPNQGQNSYSLTFFGTGGLLYTSGSPPLTGVQYTETIDCQPPGAPPNDCSGGVTVCNGQSFSNNSSGTGSVIDLTGANQGCLASGERQGTWYYFSPSASGTIGFTITPVVATDYDFAVWGPMASITCPPPGPPLRCSYSALQVPTGCGNGAADVTEGAGGNAWVSTFNVLAGQIYILYVDNFSTNGQAFSLSWQLTNGASLDCTVLPIELVSLHAEPTGNAVEVRWITATELDNDHFEIERSSNGEDFTQVGWQEGAGTSFEEQHYLHTDATPHEGVNYYRLKQVDLDGHFEYSAAVSTVFRSSQGSLLLFPNPGSGTVEVLLPPHLTSGLLEIEDATGRVVLHQQMTGQRWTVDASHLPLGVYSFRVLGTGYEALARGRWIKQ